MPLLGYVFATFFRLPIDYSIGLLLVACCPGGTASNVVCFIARANVALSVSLTACSTLLAVIITPLLTAVMVESVSQNLVGLQIEVDTVGLLIKTFNVVIIPIVVGVFLNHYFHSLVQRVNTFSPVLAVFSIIFIVNYILAAKKEFILQTGAGLIIAILGLHSLGFALGYLLSRFLRLQEIDARTVSIEVGMQNSGLATELARSSFSSYGLATVPGALSALTHCVLGSIAAGLCRVFRDPPQTEQEVYPKV